MENVFKLDILNFINKNETALVGRQDAYNFRKLLKSRNLDLPELETKFDRIDVVIPESIVTVNRSYFLGAFADRVKALGKTGFLVKYNFKTDDYIKQRIEEHVDNALLEASPSAILNAR